MSSEHLIDSRETKPTALDNSGLSSEGLCSSQRILKETLSLKPSATSVSADITSLSTSQLAACAVASIEGITVGGIKAAAEELKHHPERTAGALVGGACAAAALGGLVALEIPAITIGCAAAGVGLTAMYLADLGQRMYSDSSLSTSLHKAGTAKNPREFNSTLPAVEQSLGKYSWQVCRDFALAGPGFKFGKNIGHSLPKGSGPFKPVLAIAGGASETGAFSDQVVSKALSEAVSNPISKHSQMKDFVLNKTVDLSDGSKINMDKGHTAEHITSDGTSTVMSRRTASNDMNILFKPSESVAETLNSVRLLEGNTLFKFPFLKSFLESSDAQTLLSNLKGAWYPECSTTKSLELRSADGKQVAQISYKGDRPNCPFLIQPLSRQQGKHYQIEFLPQFQRKLDQPVPEILNDAFDKTVWHSTDRRPHDIGYLSNGFPVVLDPHSVMQTSHPDYLSQLKPQDVWFYENSLNKLEAIYGQNSPTIKSLKTNISEHLSWAGNDGALDVQTHDKLLNELIESKQWWQASEAAKALFYECRELSNRGTNDNYVNKAMNYFNVQQELLQKHYQQTGY